MALAEVAAKGVRLETLRQLRDDLAARMAVCSSDQNYASLAQRLMDVLAQIEASEKASPEKAGTAVDELKRRRESAGLPDASGTARAARSAVRR